MLNHTFPLTNAQKRIWYTEQFFPTTSISNIGGIIRFTENIDTELLRKAIKAFICLNDSVRLRMTVDKNNEVSQYVAAYDEQMKIDFFDYSDAEGEVRMYEWLESLFLTPFPLADSDLYYFAVLKDSNGQIGFLIQLHHLISDGITTVQVIKQIVDFYIELSKGLDVFQETNVAIPPSYTEYISYETEYLSSERFKKDQNFWLGQFETLPEFTGLKTYDIYAISTRAKRKSVVVPKALHEQIQAFCKEQNIGVFTLVLSMLYVYLYRVSGHNDIAIGTNFSNRTNANEKNMIGMFTSTVPFRVLVEETDALSFMRQVAKKQMQIFRHQKYPYNLLINDLREKHHDINRLFSVFAEYQAMDFVQKEGVTYSTEGVFMGHEANDFVLHIKDNLHMDTLALDLDYRTDVFSEAEIERLLAQLLLLTEDAVQHPEKEIARLEICSAEEKQQLLVGFNQTGADYPRDKTIHAIFEEQVEKTPENMAVVCDGETVTYAQLNERANQVARLLRDQGVKPDTLVGLLVERSLEMIVGIMAILKAGGVYVPVDPEYPQDRKEFMLEDSGAAILLTQTDLIGTVPFSGDVIDLADATTYTGETSNLPHVNRPEDMAYIIYTSGTTGKPKGVMIEHRNVIRLMINDQLPFDFNEHDVWTVFHSYCFDFSVWEMYGALLYGGKAVIVPKIVAQNPTEFNKLLKQEKVTVLNQTPTAFYTLINDENQYESTELAIRYVVFGGEALNPIMLKPFRDKYPATKLINMYGITETTVHVTFKEIGEREIETNVSNIGKPIPTLTTYIFDQKQQLVPIGVTGEMYVGGDGVARGYLNREELTSERFIQNPYQPSERLYRAGDLARLLPNGEMEYMGRIDHQVKIRGYRIELGEIETQLLLHENISETIVLAIDDASGQKVLVAYLISDVELTVSALRNHLSVNLPAYMIPSFFIRLEKMPMTANGKVDRRALPKPEAAISTATAYVAPRSELETKLATIWQDVLEVTRIGVEDNFFELGGHSLKAMTIISRIQKELNVEVPLRVLFEKTTIAGIAPFIGQADGEAYKAIQAVEKREYYPTSSAQKRLFILSQFEGAGTSYNMPAIMFIEGQLDTSRFIEAFEQLVERHETLRTSFVSIDGEPFQLVHDDVSFGVFYQEASEEDIEAIADEFMQPFDLSDAPLFRVGLVKLADERHLFLIDMHHIISDGVSIINLVREIGQFYHNAELSELRLHYKDYAVWQQERFASGAMQKQEAFWLESLAGELPVLDLPSDYQRPSVQSFEGETILFHSGADLMNDLNKLAQESGTTLYMVLLAAYNVLLSKYTNQADIIVGTPVAGRPHADVQDMIGMFVNTLALRSYPEAKQTFGAYLAALKEVVLHAFDNQDYPFEMLVEKLQVSRDLSRNPIFDTLFNLTSIEMQTIELDGLTFVPYTRENKIAKFDLSLDAIQGKDELLFALEYCTKLFTHSTIERLAAHYLQILQAIVANPAVILSEMEMLSQVEQEQILVGFNDTAVAYPTDKTFHQLFEAQVEKTPDQVAVTFADTHLSYRALNAKANQLARRLRGKGVQPDSIVGIMVNRSLEMIVSVLAVQKAGGAYLPIDPEYPQDRIQYLLEDSQAMLLLAERGLESQISFEREIIYVDDALFTGDDSNLETIQGGEHLAYIIYTSGTTGQPKGVMVEQRNYMNVAYAWREVYKLETFQVNLLQMASFSFDVFAGDVARALLHGGQLIICPNDIKLDPASLYDLMCTYQINIFESTPALISPLMGYIYENGLDISQLKLLILGSDTCSVDEFTKLLTRFGHSMRIVNSYGVTEATIDSSFYEQMPDSISYSGNVPIGKPLANMTFYVVSESLKPVPIGVPGELCIGGAGVARGYFNKPEMTADKFIDNPFVPSEKMYRTGDMARWMADGSIQFLGRGDHQVKVRGFRIELGEIETVLLKHEQVREAIVVAREDQTKQKYLSAYIVASEPLPVADLRTHLGAELPSYMVPSFFVQLERMPLTPNGKIDKRALPAPEGNIQVATEYVPSTHEGEEKLVAVWQAVLGIKRIGINDDFFQLGGHSLKAMTLISQMHKAVHVEVPLRVLFQSPTIKEIAAYIQDASHATYEEITPIEEQAYYPTSSAQKRMYVLNQIDGSGTTYNMADVMLIEGKLDMERFQDTLRRLHARHEAFRTAFVTVDGEPVQKVHDHIEPIFSYVEAAADQVEALREAFVKPFDLAQAPLMRTQLVKLAEDRHAFLVDMHHIISDGVSVAVLVQEFAHLYEQEVLPDLRIQYKDFAVWQNQLFQSGLLKKQAAYWMDAFQGELPVLDMPTDFARPSVRSFTGDRIKFASGKEILSGLNQLATQTGTTLYMVLLAAYNVLISKYSGQDDIIVGSPVAGRPHADVQNIIGMFVNTLAMRNAPRAEKSFADFLQEVKENSLRAFENQAYPFEELVEQLDVLRDMSRNPVFDVMFLLQNTDTENFELNDLTFTSFGMVNKIAKFDLTLEAVEEAGELWFGLEFCTALFTHATIERMIGHFLTLLRGIIANPQAKLAEIEMMTEAEKQHLLHDLNQTNADYPRDALIHSLFEEQAVKTPDHIAVTCEAKTLTYRELNKRANQVAHVLRDKGVKPDGLVGIMVERSLDLIVGIMAIMKAGGVYVPIDPSYPEERIAFMLEDSEASILLTQTHLVDTINFTGLTIDMADASLYTGDTGNLPHVNKPADMAYIIYTSGTTGKPKGVMIEHRHVVRLMMNDNIQFDFTENDVWTMFHSFCFDFSVWEMYGALLYGGKVVIVPKVVAQNPIEFAQLLRTEGVTVLNQTPTAFYTLIHAESQLDVHNLGIRYVVFGGEALNPVMLKPFRAWYPETKLINMYGITETTVHVTFKEIGDAEMQTNLSNIGVPIPTLTTYIFDQNQKLVPIGVAGEMYVGGEGVARGYLRREELTAERFFTNPYKPEERLYKSGDLARMLPNGEMEYLGRIDHQVKIRGHRIELGEIETQLLKQEAIKEVIVIDFADADGQRALCGYIVTTEELTVSELRAHIAKDLPAYMIPAYFVRLAQMPMTSNGKVDRRALPKPELGMVAGTEYVAPSTPIEEQLVVIWQNVLEAERVGVIDNFFELGGHSLKAMVLISAMHKACKVEVPLKVFFDNPTVQAIAAHIEGAGEQSFVAIEPIEKREHYAVSSAQKRMYILNQFEGAGIGYNMPGVMIVEGSLDVARFEAAFQALIARHETLRTSFITINGEPVQRVHDTVTFEIAYSEASEAEVDSVVQGFIKPFDLAQAPLLRVALVKLADERYAFFTDMHHIISDGVSIGILIKECTDLYQGLSLPEQHIQYKDFAAWQNNRFTTDKSNKQETFWLHTLAGELPVLDLPTDFPRPSLQSFDGAAYRFESGSDVLVAVNRLATETGTTLYMVLLAAYNVLLSKYADQEDLVIGSPTAGRQHADVENVIGMFVNTLAMRNQPEAGKTFAQFLQEVKANALSAFENQEYPFEALVEKLDLRRDLSRNPLFDTMFILQNMDAQAIKLDDVTFVPYESANNDTTAVFDLTIAATETADQISFHVEYGTRLFTEATIARMMTHFLRIIERAVANPHITLAEIVMLTDEEKQQILVDFNRTEAILPTDQTLHSLFEEQVMKTPEQVAVTFGSEQLTYRELNARANQLARTLREKGVAPESVVGIMADRSLEMIVAVFAVMKAGGAYVPIDPAYPQERIQYMLEDSGARLVLTQPHLMTKAGFAYALEWFDLTTEDNYAVEDANLEAINSVNDLAYMIYTSGTTGKPKGVMIEHRNVVNAIGWRKIEYALDTTDVVLQLFSFAFDGFVTSFFTPIISGSTVVILPEDEAKDPLAIKKQIADAKVTHFISVPSLYNAIIDVLSEAESESLRIITLAGEKVTENIIEASKAKNANIELVNEYGPTENSVVTTIYRNMEPGETISIGRPIANSRVYIVDANNQLQPIGVTGELCIAGAGLARGYLNRQDLTDEKFMISPFLDNERIYKTGDLARWLPDGNIDYVGRLDDQVKVRGYRIELGEIESVLLKHEQVKETVVLALGTTGSEKALVAYVVTEGLVITSELRDHTAQALPAYMVPSFFIQLDNMPLTPNGKVDKKALPAPDSDTLVRTTEYVAPATEVEAKLVGIMESILEREQVGMHDNFFDLGGHSLKAMTLVSHIYKELNVEVPLRAIFETATTQELAQFIENAGEQSFHAIMPAPEQAYYAVSSAQKRMFVLNQIEGSGTSYNMPGAMRVTGKLDTARFEAAFCALIERHETLRTTFMTVGDEIVQKVQASALFSVEYHEGSEEHIEALFHAFVRPFDLSQAPLLRVGLVQVAEESYLLLFDTHHIISDGVSMSVLIREFVDLYDGEGLPAMRVQYKDFALWQNQLFASDEFMHQEAYWLQTFSDEVPMLDLPTDYARPSVRSFAGDHYVTSIDQELAEALNKLARETNTSLYMVMLAAYNVLLAKYTGQQDIVVGSPIAGRRHADLANIIGMFVNTLALRHAPAREKTFTQFLQEVKENTFRAFESQEYPFEMLVEKRELHRNLSRNPLFDTMFILQNIDMPTIDITDVTFSPFELVNKVAKFDLTMMAIEEGDGITLSVEYGTALFKAETIARFAAHFVEVLRHIAWKPTEQLGKINMLTESEQEHVLVACNQTATPFAKDQTIESLFQQQVTETPDNVAVVFMDKKLRYRELNAKANQLARVLVDKGIGTESIVGVMMDRSVEMVVAVLAIIKAGGAYLPIDIEYPQERIRYMLDDSQTKIVLTQQKVAQDLAFDGEMLILEDLHLEAQDDSNLNRDIKPTDLAYVIYTSGTTGLPKGTMLEHTGISNLKTFFAKQMGVTATDRIGQFASTSFDASVWEMFMALLAGATLYILPKEVINNYTRFEAFLNEHQISVMTLPPTYLIHLHPDNVHSLRTLVTAGSATSFELISKWEDKVTYINAYGPTETSICATIWEATSQGMTSANVSIGSPIVNTQIYILDADDNLQPVGVVGELCVGGVTLARGYVNRRELTAEKFPANPFVPGERMYRTGDLARWLPDGTIEYLGRIDHQVKIRGYRIEVGEIESTLQNHDRISEVAVLAREDESKQKYLCAYFTAETSLTTQELREFVGKNLPEYMVPSYFVQLADMPLTPNGKIDRKALPEPDKNIGTGEQYEAPRNETESLLATIWQDVLGVERIGIKDNFFALGGDSIKAIQVSTHLYNNNLKLEIKDLFQHPTIGEVSYYLTSVSRKSNQGIVTGEVPLTAIQKWFFTQQFTDMHHWNQAVILHSQAGFETDALKQAFTKIVEHHDALRMVYQIADGNVTQINRGLEEGDLFSLTTHDVTGEANEAEAITAIASHIQASIDLTTGPLVKLALFHAKDGDHLLIVIHHLGVDGISWRILFEDLASAYAQASQGQAIALPEKTDSFKDWSQQIQAYANSTEFVKEVGYWREREQTTFALLPKDHTVASSKLQDQRSASFQLSVEETDNLLKHAHQAYNTDVTDILLTSLGLTVKEWTKHDHVLLNLEGHGREEVIKNVNISRTVGWFTSQFPVILDMEKSHDIAYQIKVIKEGMRHIPNKGLGYDILRHLTAPERRPSLAFTLKPEIGFNYLGQFDSDVQTDVFGPSAHDIASPLSPNSERLFTLDVTAMIQGGKLHMSFAYSSLEYAEATMTALLDTYKKHLLAVIDHCLGKEGAELTPTDLGDEDLSLEELDDLLELFE